MFLITRRKRCAALFLAVFLSCSCIMSSHQEAHALAIGGVAVTAGEVVVFLLAAFGIVAASAAVYENSDSIKAWGEEQLEEFKLYASGFTAVTGKTAEELAADIDVWTALAITGTLDKASYVYDMFKKWCEGLALDDSSASSGGMSFATPEKNVYVYDFLEYEYPRPEGSTLTGGFEVKGYTGPCYTIYFVCPEQDGFNPHILTVSEYPFSGIISGALYPRAKARTISVDGVERKFYYAFCKLGSASWDAKNQQLTSEEDESLFLLSHLRISLILTYLSSLDAVKDFVSEKLYLSVLNGLNFGSFAITESVASKIIARDRAIANVDIIPADAIADVGVETVPIDWSKIRSVAGALSDVVEGASTIDAVLNQVGVEVIDKTGAITVPVPPADTGEFTIEGLESLFPFCLPFDLVDFFQVLSAEPEAPHFQWPIRYMAPDGPKEYVVDIDLSPFDSVAAILRKMELLAFIVGLIMITREKMIRG